MPLRITGTKSQGALPGAVVKMDPLRPFSILERSQNSDSKEQESDWPSRGRVSILNKQTNTHEMPKRERKERTEKVLVVLFHLSTL